MTALPNISTGARFWGYHLKPLDNPAYFVTSSPLYSGPPSELEPDLWANTAQPNIWFSPTQLLLTLTPGAGSPDVRTLVVVITGRDQFGFPVDETLAITANGTPRGVPAATGSARCFSHIDSIAVVPDETTAVDGDSYTIGVGRSQGDVASSSPRAENSYRIPLPARVRAEVSVLAVQDVGGGAIWLPDHLASPPIANQITIDLESQAVEIVLDSGDARDLAIILEPNTTCI